jgi:hypothetical protein
MSFAMRALGDNRVGSGGDQQHGSVNVLDVDRRRIASVGRPIENVVNWLIGVARL